MKRKTNKKDDSRIERLKLYATIATLLTALVNFAVQLAKALQ